MPQVADRPVPIVHQVKRVKAQHASCQTGLPLFHPEGTLGDRQRGQCAPNREMVHVLCRHRLCSYAGQVIPRSRSMACLRMADDDSGWCSARWSNDGQMILTEPFRADDHGPDLHFLVELRGFEPLTPSDANEVCEQPDTVSIRSVVLPAQWAFPDSKPIARLARSRWRLRMPRLGTSLAATVQQRRAASQMGHPGLMRASGTVVIRLYSARLTSDIPRAAKACRVRSAARHLSFAPSHHSCHQSSTS
jgi:hypothetical protein